MNTKCRLVPLLVAAALSASAADSATNALVGTRAHLEACGLWDEAAHAAFEAQGPAAAASAPQPRAVSAEEHAALWLDLVDFALADLAAPPPPQAGSRVSERRKADDWFAILRTRLPEPSQWAAVLRALDERAGAFASGTEPPLLAALRILFGGLADERPAARAGLETNFPPAPDAEAFGRNPSNPEFFLWIRLEWTRARGFLARDLSDIPPDLSAYVSALRENLDLRRRRDLWNGMEPETSDLLLSLPDAELDALLDEWIEDESLHPDAKWRIHSNGPFRNAPGVLARVRRRLLDRVRDGVPREREGAVLRFAAHAPCGYLEDEEPEGVELLRLSLPFRVEAAAASTNENERWFLSNDLRVLLERAERDGDGDEAERLRDFLARIGEKTSARPPEQDLPDTVSEIRKNRPFAEATAALMKFWETRDAADSAPPLPGLYDWLQAAQAADGREPENRAAIESALPAIGDWLKTRDVGPGCFCNDRFEFLLYVELLERLGRFAEAERRLWESIGTEGDWDADEDVAPLFELYARAGRPQDVVDFAEGYRTWARQDFAEIDSLCWSTVVPAVVRSLADLGRTNEADRLAVWFEISPDGPLRPFDAGRDPWEMPPQRRIDELLECGYRGEALRVATAAGLPEPPAAPVLPKHDPWSHWRFAPLAEFRETVREDVRKTAGKPLPPVPPVFPAARIPVGDGGPALGGLPEYGLHRTDAALPPAGVPDRFAPLFARRQPHGLLYPHRNGWLEALDCLLRWRTP